MRGLILAPLVLAACNTGAPPDIPPGAGFVEVFSGSGFVGSTTLKIYETDTFERTDQEAGKEPRLRFSKATPGTYERVRASLAAEVESVTAPTFEDCPTDWPINVIRMEPPVRGIARIEADCSDNGFDAVRAAVVADLPR